MFSKKNKMTADKKQNRITKFLGKYFLLNLIHVIKE